MATPKFLVVLALLCVVGIYADSTSIAPEFEINLDLDPEHRWVKVAEHYKPYVPIINQYFNDLAKDVPKVALKALELIAGRLDSLLGDFGKEIRGISKTMEMDIGTLVILNFSYELRKLGGPPSNSTGPRPGACTSIVAEASNQDMFHARNLDWNLPNEMRRLTYTGVFKKGGKVMYKGSCFIGFVGILTGFAFNPKGDYGVSIDERLLGGSPIIDSLEGIFRGGWSPTHLIRHAIETSYNSATPYETAVQILSSKHLTAPAYFIISGEKAGQGTILTRDRNSNADSWTLTGGSKKKVDPAIQKWYLLQTNYDHWNEPPSYDNRRTPGIKYMNQMGQNNVNAKNLFNVMGLWPVNNNHTSYTAIMDYKAKSFVTHIRYL